MISPAAPITQDLLTVPRKLPEGGPLNLVGLTREALKAQLVGMGVPERESRMRAGQIWHWVNFRGASDFAEMTNVGKALKAQLAEHFTLERPEVASRQVSRDVDRSVQPSTSAAATPRQRARLVSASGARTTEYPKARRPDIDCSNSLRSVSNTMSIAWLQNLRCSSVLALLPVTWRR